LFCSNGFGYIDWLLRAKDSSQSLMLELTWRVIVVNGMVEEIANLPVR
jgi:hypothetical protein